MKQSDLKKILVPVDGSDQSFSAASFAIEVAKRFNAELRLLHVVTINQSFRAIGLYGLSYDDAVKDQVNEARKEVDKWFGKISKEAEEQEIRTSSDIMDTSISVVGEIVDYAEKNNTDLIVMGTKGIGGFTRILVGSVATGVITYAPCPVLVVR